MKLIWQRRYDVNETVMKPGRKIFHENGRYVRGYLPTRACLGHSCVYMLVLYFSLQLLPHKRSEIAKTISKQGNKIFSPGWFGFVATSDEANKIKTM